MRGVFVLALSITVVGAFAQNVAPAGDLSNNPAANSGAGTTAAPRQPQPQGPTGPTKTTSGGAPAASPQGDTPPGMQPKPQDLKKEEAPKN